MTLAHLLVNTPTLNWEGVDAIGQKASITGDLQRGYEFRYFDEESQTWRTPADLDEYRWIVEAFLGDITRSSDSKGVG